MTFPRYHWLSAEPPQPSAPLPTPIVFERSEPQRWEYHVATIDPREESPLDDADLATLGAEGWLLAGIVHFPTSAAPTRILYYFVRSAA